ncbi:MAG TPA: Hsp20/alpha crystallin family protein [Gemmatimonadales bacterium]|nr:Hsp20/alpha crystallin family protein [Gemmatimonadales bacterium]
MPSIIRVNSPLLSDIHTVQGRLQQLFEEALHGWPVGTPQEGSSLVGSWIPPVDVFEDKDAVRITVELPGVRPEDVKISLESNLLTIRGEKHQVAEEKTDLVHRYERNYGVFERSFMVPSTVDADHIHATYDMGVLTVRLPKVEKAKPRQIAVKVESAKKVEPSK